MLKVPRMCLVYKLLSVSCKRLWIWVFSTLSRRIFFKMKASSKSYAAKIYVYGWAELWVLWKKQTCQALACKTSANRCTKPSGTPDWPRNTSVRTSSATRWPWVASLPSRWVQAWNRIRGAANMDLMDFLTAYNCPTAPRGTAHAFFPFSSSHSKRCVVSVSKPVFSVHPAPSQSRSTASTSWHSTSPCCRCGLPLLVSCTECIILVHAPSISLSRTSKTIYLFH